MRYRPVRFLPISAVIAVLLGIPARCYKVPCYKAQIVLEWLELQKDEFQLMSFPPNSLDLNSIEHIWDVMERHLKHQHVKILASSDCCLVIWNNLSQIIYRELVESMLRRIAAVLRAKSGATRNKVGGHVMAFHCTSANFVCSTSSCSYNVILFNTGSISSMSQKLYF